MVLQLRSARLGDIKDWYVIVWHDFTANPGAHLIARLELEFAADLFQLAMGVPFKRLFESVMGLANCWSQNCAFCLQ